MGLEIPLSTIIVFVLITGFIIFLAIRKDIKDRKKPNFIRDVHSQTIKYGLSKTFKNNRNGTNTFILKSKINKR